MLSTHPRAPCPPSAAAQHARRAGAEGDEAVTPTRGLAGLFHIGGGNRGTSPTAKTTAPARSLSNAGLNGSFHDGHGSGDGTHVFQRLRSVVRGKPRQPRAPACRQRRRSDM